MDFAGPRRHHRRHRQQDHRGGSRASQTVPHGLGETLKALILWTDGKTNESFSGSFVFGFSATDGSSSRSVVTASQNNVDSSNASRRLARKELTLVHWGETLLAEADLSRGVSPGLSMIAPRASGAR